MFNQKTKAELESIKTAIDARNSVVIKRADEAFAAGLRELPPLDQLSQRPRVQIEEHYFVNVFLPWFAKDAELPYPQVSVEAWVGLVKDIFAEVEVVNPQGHVVVVIPALRDRDLMSTAMPGRDERDTLTAIINELQAFDHFGVAYRDEAIKHRFIPKINRYRNTKRVIEIARMWNEVMKHYGRPPLYDLSKLPGELAHTSGNSTPNQSSDQSVLDEYDPL